MSVYVSYDDIGAICKRYRQSINKTQTDVANDLHYTTQNISNFERGINDNATILLWYVMHGLNPAFIKYYGGKL